MFAIIAAMALVMRIDDPDLATEMLEVAIAKHAGTLCWMPNFAFGHLERLVSPDEASMSLGSMRAFIDCSEPCDLETLQRFEAHFATPGVKPEMLQVCYAMAETTFAVSQTAMGRAPTVLRLDTSALRQGFVRPSPTGTTALLSAGHPLRGARVAIRDAQSGELLVDQVGELWVSAEFVFSGYHNLPAFTEERLVDGAVWTTSSFSTGATFKPRRSKAR